MAWYYGTYSCGHEGRVDIIGPGKFRQYKADREFEKLCPDCFEEQLKEQHEKENQEALEKAKETELPQLQGSEKQVAWANTIRQKFIDKFIENGISQVEYAHMWTSASRNQMPQHQVRDIAYICIKECVNAHEWIDNREQDFLSMFKFYHKELIKTEDEKAEDKAIEEIKKESTVYPSNKVTEAVAEIRYTKDKISTSIDHKNEDFINIVKSLGYKYYSKWQRNIDYTAGKVEDRVAELGNKLLNKGFPIMVLDEAVRNNAINGIYEKEHTRWIYIRIRGDYAGCLAIKWQGHNNSLYETAKSIPGAHWSNGYMVLKVMHYKEVQDFADLYNFKFTQKALEAIEEYKRETEKIPIVNPVKVTEEQQQDNKLEDILKSSSDILEDLKDD